jgi:predicted nucleotidyltransferase
MQQLGAIKQGGAMSGIPWAGQSGSPLSELERMLSCHWKNIDEARRRTQATLQQLSKIIEIQPGSDSSVIVHGSLARYECTQGSDLDWTLLVDGQSDAKDQKRFLAIKDALSDHVQFKELGLKEPGKEGTFGAMAFSQPMMHHIGGEEDSNSNTTRRVLLLLEGLPIGERREAFDRVRKGILNRYIDEDRGLLQRSQDNANIRWIPLFLLNDFARYWRTMAVDFAYKQFDRGNKGYALRSIKLGVSRKLLFASGLLACFWCDPAVSKTEVKTPNQQSLIDCLDIFLSFTPLERFAWFFTVHIRAADSRFLRETARDLFGAYDAFLGLLNDAEKRTHIEALNPNDAGADNIFNEARTMRRNFRIAIQNMFLGEGSPLREHSIEKGVF